MRNRLVILGSGESGTGAALLAKREGFDVFVSDLGTIAPGYKAQLDEVGIPFEEGVHTESEVLAADEIIKSPGIPPWVPLVKRAKEQGIPVIDEIEFAARYTKGRIIAITGSNGKTTTTHLTGHLLKQAGLDVGVAGNIGKSLARSIVERDRDFWVLEVSSFQLEGVFDARFEIAMVLNITPDHLDRYGGSVDAYAEAKYRITRGQQPGDHLILSGDDERLVNWSKSQLNRNIHFFSVQKSTGQSAWIEKESLIININGELNMSIQKLALQGKHNTANSMAGGIAARILEIRKGAIRDSLEDVSGVEHRMEYVTSISGVRYINDSKATNVNASWFALESMEEPVVWIAGGVDKGNDYSELYDLVQDKVRAIITLGADCSKIHAAFESRTEMIIDASSMEEAVAIAYRVSGKGEAVLLSPACASFDLFDSYEDRGDRFKAAVRAL